MLAYMGHADQITKLDQMTRRSRARQSYRDQPSAAASNWLGPAARATQNQIMSPGLAGLVWHSTEATVRDYGGHMHWPTCWDEVLRFPSANIGSNRLITS